MSERATEEEVSGVSLMASEILCVESMRES